VNRFSLLVVALIVCASCGRPEAPTTSTDAVERPSILLVTLDTTRADAIGPDTKGVTTPAFNAIAAKSLRFRQAYATAPQTLPSHASMMTGLYPAGHGVHENARQVDAQQSLLAENLHSAGYATAAFVSAFPLARRFGLSRGFDLYDDVFGDRRNERSARETTDRALAWLAQDRSAPLFLWVHYYDPHAPYEPPDAFRARYANDPYRGEIAAMDEQLGRLVSAFEAKAAQRAMIIVADHGEGLGEHGESQHGNLLYQGVMHVPLLVSGPGFKVGTVDTPVSTRRVFHTIAAWAGVATDASLHQKTNEVVVGEAMVPFLQYGWRPQVMALETRHKAILAGSVEVYDVAVDPAERTDLAGQIDLSRAVRKSLSEYPVPSLTETAAGKTLDEESRKQLASLGYVTADVKPVVRQDAPRPRDMARLFPIFDAASGAFERGEYKTAIPLLQQILSADPHNLMAALRLAAAHSALGQNDAALAAFAKAESIAPRSPDVRRYLALHHAKSGATERAGPMLEQILIETPDWLPALEALADIREKQGQLEETLRLRRRIHGLKPPNAAELLREGQLAMAVGDTPTAIAAFEQARTMQGAAFRNDLELGVLYLAARRYDEARNALDRVSANDRAYPMALFKRAQVSVVLNESDRAERIRRARQHADATTRELIARERLFR
jgi:tetratricopeptide (TPR) repeat protein